MQKAAKAVHLEAPSGEKYSVRLHARDLPGALKKIQDVQHAAAVLKLGRTESNWTRDALASISHKFGRFHEIMDIAKERAPYFFEEYSTKRNDKSDPSKSVAEIVHTVHWSDSPKPPPMRGMMSGPISARRTLRERIRLNRVHWDKHHRHPKYKSIDAEAALWARAQHLGKGLFWTQAPSRLHTSLIPPATSAPSELTTTVEWGSNDDCVSSVHCAPSCAF